MAYRAATTVVCLLTVALGLQLVAVLTVPVTKSITLCTYGGYKFGVFGFCTRNGTCSPVQVGYSRTTVEELAVFSLPFNTRRSISKLLVVHPISVGFTFILVLLSGIIHSVNLAPAKNLRLLFISLLWTLPTFLLSLLSFLVDILLFAPHLDWSGWIILGSTVLIAVCGAMLCIMRRSTSSRFAMDQNNRLMNSQSHRYSMSGFGFDDDGDYSCNSGLNSAHSSDNMLQIEPSMESFIHNNDTGGQDSANANHPVRFESSAPLTNNCLSFNYHNNSNNESCGYGRSLGNLHDIITVTETISNNSRLPLNNNISSATLSNSISSASGANNGYTTKENDSTTGNSARPKSAAPLRKQFMMLPELSPHSHSTPYPPLFDLDLYSVRLPSNDQPQRFASNSSNQRTRQISTSS